MGSKLVQNWRAFILGLFGIVLLGALFHYSGMLVIHIFPNAAPADPDKVPIWVLGLFADCGALIASLIIWAFGALLLPYWDFYINGKELSIQEEEQNGI